MPPSPLSPIVMGCGNSKVRGVFVRTLPPLLYWVVTFTRQSPSVIPAGRTNCSFFAVFGLISPGAMANDFDGVETEVSVMPTDGSVPTTFNPSPVMTAIFPAAIGARVVAAASV